MSPPRRIAVCVDDFGLNHSVNEGALSLVDAGRVSALSCLTRGAAWKTGAALLRTIPEARTDVGLHLNLSEVLGAPQWHLPLPMLWLAAYTRALPKDRVRAEIAKQFDAFEDEMECAPDFVDGHQHVHQLPVVRELLLEELARRHSASQPWLRNTLPSASLRRRRQVSAKHRLIAALGARPMAAAARAHGYPQNRSLAGVYGFTGSAADHALRLASWCEAMEDGDLLMVHVAAAWAADDPIAAARVVEHEVLRGPAFGDLLGTRLAVVRLSELL